MLSMMDTVDVHDTLDVGVAAARRAAVAGDVLWARNQAALIAQGFRAHRHQEETLWMPIYKQRCSPPPNASVSVLMRDHRRIAGLFEAIPALRGLDLVDVLQDLADQLDHHDRRETRWFKPLLDEVLSEEERAKFLETHDSSLGLAVVSRKPHTPWVPPPTHPMVQAVRQAVLDGQHPDLEPILSVCGSDRFGVKVQRQLAAIDPENPMETLARLRTVAIILNAREKVASLGLSA